MNEDKPDTRIFSPPPPGATAAVVLADGAVFWGKGIGATGSAVEWWFNGPDSKGYYYIDNVAASQSLKASGTAPAITFSMVNDPSPSAQTQWRLIEPYRPGIITAPAPPVASVTYSNQSANLTWTGNGSFYSIYRGTTSGV